MPTFDVTNKTALITGANRGIGKAFVEALLQRGARKVYAGARDIGHFATLKALHPEIVEPVLLDVTNADHIRNIAVQLPDLDLLVNNAGIATACFNSAAQAGTVARQDMATNYFGPLDLILALLPALKKSRGAMVNISSIAGISNFPSLGPYSATKAALHSLTQGLRTELQQDGVLVAGVYPGPIDTRLTENFDMPKPPPALVAQCVLDALHKGETDIFPDDFAQQMYTAFLTRPGQLEKAFAEMHTR